MAKKRKREQQNTINKMISFLESTKLKARVMIQKILLMTLNLMHPNRNKYKTTFSKNKHPLKKFQINKSNSKKKTISKMIK